MPTTLPTPVAAALGVVPTVLDSARRLPGRAVQLPVLAVASTLTLLESWRREYDELAGRGERLVARLRGEVEGAEYEEWLGGAVEQAGDVVGEIGGQIGDDIVSTVSDLLDRAASPKAFTGTPVPTDSAAPAEAVAVAELVTAAVTTGAPGHADLPLPDYDHLTLGALRGKLASLTVEQLVQVRDYEKAHADRLPVVTLLDNKLAKLAAQAPEAVPATKAPAKKAVKKAEKKAPAKKATVPPLDV